MFWLVVGEGVFRGVGSRVWVAVFGVLAVAGCSAGAGPVAVSSTARGPSVRANTDDGGAELRRLEGVHGVRLGVYAVDTGSGRVVAHRAEERFAYASTFKAFAAALVLRGTTAEQLAEAVPVRAADILDNSPVSERRVGGVMTWREVCDAAVRYSDNTAGNLLLRKLGGPAGFTAGLRGVGDDVTSADRYEPDLSSAVPGDHRDTSTPRAMAGDLRAFAVGDALDGDDRALLVDWLRNNTTGAAVVRAGVPRDWVVGDKTGSARYGGRNDIAVLWPPNRAPIVVAVLTSRDQPTAPRVDAAIADAARVVVRVLA